ncbi:MAG: ABC transporter ATP-binding protein [Prevotella sp.]|nr:ABC transporter ATP-binding protein [Prevotella sp.]
MNNETIQLRNLSIGYQTKHSVKAVAAGINGAIRSGELTCLLGANGVGKSTLLRTLAAFQPAISGEILISRKEEGGRRKEITSLTDKELSKLIGVVLTEKPDVRNMSVRELVSLGRSPYTGFWGTYTDEDLRIVDEAIEMVGITDLVRRPVHTLSDGERQKVMIAKALAQQTPVIFLDEPTAFLDYPSKVEVLQLLRRISREAEKTIFLSTHDVELALQLADTIWLMRKVEERGKRKEERDMTKHEEEGRRPVTIGSPEELAASGDLGLFIERQNIVFDKETLTIKVKK